MARKERNLAGFGELAGDESKNNTNINNNINVKNDIAEGDYIDSIIEGQNKKTELILTGIYLHPDLAALLDKLGKQGGRGAKSRIVNDALRTVFNEKGLL